MLIPRPACIQLPPSACPVLAPKQPKHTRPSPSPKAPPSRPTHFATLCSYKLTHTMRCALCRLAIADAFTSTTCPLASLNLEGNPGVNDAVATLIAETTMRRCSTSGQQHLVELDLSATGVSALYEVRDVFTLLLCVSVCKCFVPMSLCVSVCVCVCV